VPCCRLTSRSHGAGCRAGCLEAACCCAGMHLGSGRVDPTGQMVVLELQWGDPVGGAGTDEFFLVAADTLHVRTTLLVNEQKVQVNVLP
jgi:hypothetical protein